MTTTAGGGILGFAPQIGKGIPAADGTWHRHKAVQLGIGIADNQQIGPQEVGGRPLPSTPYKTGVSVGGAAVIHPRLENSFGWLLYSALGYQVSHEAGISFSDILDSTLLTSGAQNITTGIEQPPSARKLCVRIWKGDSQNFTGKITITDSESNSEDFDFSTGPSAGQRSVGLLANETIVGAVAFANIASISLPATALSDIYVTVGWEDSNTYANSFGIDPNHPSRVRWIGVRKYMPGGDDDVSDYGIGETYQDCKVLGLGFTLPNNDLIASQLSILGRTFKLEEDPAWGIASGTTGGWAADGEFEGFESIPIGCQVSGYLTIPAFDGLKLPIIQGNISIANTPIDTRLERIYGSPFLQGITIGSRSVAVDVNCLLNQNLYRQIVTGSKLGTVWSPKPFTSRVDALSESPDYIPGAYVKYGLRSELTKVMLGLTGVIPLVGNQGVVMRFSGVAIDTTADYCRFTLTNKQNGYTWPS